MPRSQAQVASAGLRHLPRYSRQIPTGDEWLSELPSHWRYERLKNVASVNDNVLAEDTDPDFEIAYVDIGGVDAERGIVEVEKLTFFQAPSRARRLVREGDIIISTVRTYLRAIARIENSPANMVVSTGFAVVRPKGIDSAFAAYALRSPYFIERVVAGSTGVAYPSISADRLASLPVAFPDTDEQRAVADFLDRETAKIDAVIAEKQRLIDLLQEKRTALITRAVVKGLEPSVPMKDSGIDWLREIPATWSVRKLKYIVSEPLKYGAGEAAELTDPELPRYIRITDVGPGGRLRQETFRSIPEEVAEPYLLSEGDVLFARSGATVGKTFLYEQSWGRAAYAGYLIRARLDGRVADPTFVYYFTQSDAYWDWLHSNFIQATIQNVSAERYAGLKIPLPPLAEQRSIVRRLKDSLRLLDRGCQRVTDAIERLREFRVAVISAAATGAIDVREER